MFWLGLGLALSTPVFALIKHTILKPSLFIGWAMGWLLRLCYCCHLCRKQLGPLAGDNAFSISTCNSPNSGRVVRFFRSKPYANKLENAKGVTCVARGRTDKKTPPQSGIVFRMRETGLEM